jgi:signal transduction histidine kinase
VVARSATGRARREWPLLVCVGLTSSVVAALLPAGPPELGTLINTGVTWSFLLCGWLVWHRQPENRVGPYMLTFGLARGLGFLLIQLAQRSGSGALETVGIILTDLAVLAFVAALVTFPDGELTTRVDRLILALVAIAVIPGELAWLAFLPAEPGAPANLLAVAPDEATAAAIDWGQRGLIVAAELMLAVVLALRWWRASTPRRRVLWPALAGAGATAFTSAVFIVQKLEGATPDLLDWALAAAFIAVPIAMLAVIVRARLARAAVGGLVMDLRADPSPEHLRDALARALRDPTLALAYWLPEYGIYADLDGRMADVAARLPGRATTLIDRGGDHVAAFVHDASLRDEPELLNAVAATAALSLENGRLQAELRARLDELRASRSRILEAAHVERRRLERDLHDGAQSRLVSMSLELGLLGARFADDPEASGQVAQVRSELAHSLQELRELARGIHPAVLTGHGLTAALESLVSRAAVPVGLHVELDDRLPEAHEVAAYYVVSETLTNVAKYADASSATVEVECAHGSLVVEVADNGCGGASTASGSGLRGLADRVEALDGRLRVWSPAGEGTRVRAEIPCA